MNLVERLRGLGNRTVGILREPLIDAADRIEQLEAEVAALKKANAILQPEQQLARITEKCKQLAAHEATIAKLRDALEAVQAVADNSDGIAGWHLNGDIATWDSILPEVDEALSLQAPTDHLMAYRSEVLEEAAVMLDKMDSEYFDGYQFRPVLPADCAEDVRAMKEKK